MQAAGKFKRRGCMNPPSLNALAGPKGNIGHGMVRAAGLEPALPMGNGILSPDRVLFYSFISIGYKVPRKSPTRNATRHLRIHASLNLPPSRFATLLIRHGFNFFNITQCIENSFHFIFGSNSSYFSTNTIRNFAFFF